MSVTQKGKKPTKHQKKKKPETGEEATVRKVSLKELQSTEAESGVKVHQTPFQQLHMIKDCTGGVALKNLKKKHETDPVKTWFLL